MWRAVAAIAVPALLSGCSSDPAPRPTARTTAPVASSSVSSTAEPAPAPPYIATAQWTRTRAGRSLHVTPTAAGRRSTDPAAEAAAWREVLMLAPNAAGVSMLRQFECHWRYAKGKATWNLEPWRKVVPLDRVVAAYCNPGGPE